MGSEMCIRDSRDALELMAELQQKLGGNYLFDRNYLITITSRLENNVSKIIQQLNLLSDQRYEPLNEVLEKIKRLIKTELFQTRIIQKYPLTIPFREINKDTFTAVGEKCANLGEIQNIIGFPVPSGFAISTYALQIFMQKNNLQDMINQTLDKLDIKTMKELEEASNSIQTLILEASIPDEIAASIKKDYEKLVSAEGIRIPVAVRSSAAQEDTASSFAGQYKSFLNVSGDNIDRYYKLVLASQFSPRAIYYFKSRGFDYNDLPMAVGVMAMVQAEGAGIVYTKPAGDPDKDYVVINAVFGLGVSAVGGETNPDVYHVSRKDTKNILLRDFGQQNVMVKGLSEGGIEHREISAKKRSQPVLGDHQISQLATNTPSPRNGCGT